MAFSGKSAFLGYAAGVAAGVTYGLNPLFAKPLLDNGASVDSILFFRYGISVILLGLWLWAAGQSFRISLKQFSRLLILGLLFTCSSLFLFESYLYIQSGLATTIVFLYPVLVALIMVFLKVYPTWQVWLSILLTFAGVIILCYNGEAETFRWQGVMLAGLSALAYAMFIVIVNRSRSIRSVPNSLLTFYALLTGTAVFLGLVMYNAGIKSGQGVFEVVPVLLLKGIDGWLSIVCLICLAVFPTIISTATLAMSTRLIGAAKASVMGVFEPVTAIVVGAAALNEPVTVNVTVGIVLAMGAVTFMVVSASGK